MKILITSDFYEEYELYETSDREDLLQTVTDLLNGREHEIDTEKHKTIASSESSTIDAMEARATADEIFFTSDLYEEE